uniref:Endonuclease/exonuclease/phosphatase domain-containing protein n=1 Tax=Denticeps clupeoides TaxID=299321 RepID=A0AAY4CVB6_9TELE
MTRANSVSIPGGGNILFASLNCRGLNNPIKRSKIFHYLHHAGAHVIFLQETHLKPSDHVRLKKGWINQTYHSSFSGKARGVAILLHKSVPFVHTSVVSDPNGRFKAKRD